MTIFYLDPANGNDGNDGSSWSDYSVPFDSSGYVQIRLEYPT